MPTIASEESEVDIEVEEMQESSEEEEDDETKEEEEAGEDELEESDNALEEAPSVTGTTRTGPLRIKLKLGAQPETKAPGRRVAQRAKNEDIESEDSDSDESQFNAYAPVPSSSRQLTARQAALASAVDPDHVNLDTPLELTSISRKKHKSASEVALRKEENARKRKNMIEKKLEDEKAETINRLLKKQSRPKNKRNTAQAQAQPPSDDDADMVVDEDGDGMSHAGAFAQQQKPMYRWVSSARRPPADAMEVDEGDQMPMASITFSVPESFLQLEVDEKTVIRLSAAVAPARCAVDGCSGPRKYRAVGKAWGVGACGLGHLKVLEGRA
ncbi:hypothetical protein C8R46DRAFT_615005 [Mycena filopes]|nr:hypothetical protein C8R46DRAFT_615005 [Mycena filopes]